MNEVLLFSASDRRSRPTTVAECLTVDDPSKLSHFVLCGVVGDFLRLEPVKRPLMSELLRSRFLRAMGSGIKASGKGWGSGAMSAPGQRSPLR
jgi:hypothetical protein